MSSLFRAVRRQVLAPSLADVSFAGRGFPPAAPRAVAALEPVPQAVLCGFEWGMESADCWEVEHRLALVSAEHAGFAYEGATMAFTLRDQMAGGPRSRSQRTRELLLGPGRRHLFLAYIGIGFAMARLPRPLWSGVLPDLGELPYHPTMSWLAVDGYGFDKAYFHTRRWVDEQRRPKPYPWQGAPAYFPRAFDQGVGRALWFIHGADVPAVDAAVRAFEPDRHGDLWSGVGLAATFAGGCPPDGFRALRAVAGEHAGQLGLGSVFAAKARDYAGFVPKHSKQAVTALTGLTVPAAAGLADDTEATIAESASVPAYEVWRRKIKAHFATGE